FIAKWADDISVHLWTRCPGQCAPGRRTLSVAFLSALSAPAVDRVAEDVRCLVCRAGADDGGHGGRGVGDADPDGVSRRPLRPATAALMLLLGWRGALLFIGLLGVPVVAAILWQSCILTDQAREPHRRAAAPASGASLLLSRSVLMFFAFFMVSAMAGAGIQSWLITILHQVHGLAIEAASSALTGYMVGMIGGVLVGGWVADRTDRHLPFVAILTIGAAALLLLIGIISLAELPTIGVLFAAGIMTGASRTPRDVMVKDAA